MSNHHGIITHQSMQYHPSQKEIYSDFNAPWCCLQSTALHLMYEFFPVPPPRAGCDIRLICKRSTAGLNSKFSFKTGSLSKAEDVNRSYYLPMAGGRRAGCMTFHDRRETLAASSIISTRCCESISEHINRYATSTSYIVQRKHPPK